MDGLLLVGIISIFCLMTAVSVESMQGKTLRMGSWHHHVFTWKQGSINGFASYLDGKLVEARDSTNTPLPATDSALYFGANQGVAEFTNGELDEIAVWSRALSASEIASTWYSKLEGNESDLIGYWDFDDLTADDRSPNQHHGTLQGMHGLLKLKFQV